MMRDRPVHKVCQVSRKEGQAWVMLPPFDFITKPTCKWCRGPHESTDTQWEQWTQLQSLLVSGRSSSQSRVSADYSVDWFIYRARTAASSFGLRKWVANLRTSTSFMTIKSFQLIFHPLGLMSASLEHGLSLSHRYTPSFHITKHSYDWTTPVFPGLLTVGLQTPMGVKKHPSYFPAHLWHLLTIHTISSPP
jgi:hypothetical protein